MSFQDIGRKGGRGSGGSSNPSISASSPYRTTNSNINQPTYNNNNSPSAKYTNSNIHNNYRTAMSGGAGGASSGGIGGVGIMQPIDMNDGRGGNNEFSAISQAILQYQVGVSANRLNF